MGPVALSRGDQSLDASRSWALTHDPPIVFELNPTVGWLDFAPWWRFL